MSNRKLSIAVLGNSTWRYVRPDFDRVLLAVNAAIPGSYAEARRATGVSGRRRNRGESPEEGEGFFGVVLYGGNGG